MSLSTIQITKLSILAYGILFLCTRTNYNKIYKLYLNYKLNNKKVKKLFSGTFYCYICCNNVSSVEKFDLCQNHYCCNECFEKYLLEQIYKRKKENKEIKCVFGHDCLATVSRIKII